jgi:hypothetical protein
LPMPLIPPSTRATLPLSFIASTMLICYKVSGVGCQVFLCHTDT